MSVYDDREVSNPFRAGRDSSAMYAVTPRGPGACFKPLQSGAGFL